MKTIDKRKALVEFCDKRSNCDDCPLSYPVCRCGCGVYFLSKHNDSFDMNFAEIDAAYNIIVHSQDNLNRCDTKADPVNRPSHYTDGKIEPIDYIEDKKLGFCLGNAIKYISRAGKKDPSKEIEDLKKARWYIERRIKEVEESKG